MKTPIITFAIVCLTATLSAANPPTEDSTPERPPAFEPFDPTRDPLIRSLSGVYRSAATPFVAYPDLLPAAPDPNFFLSSPFGRVDQLGAG